ncbi:hypothetical protein SDC9_119574 [bioreactor metagenome]|uniref:Uncharacterized protein n=1 Tax=bioreactor metagenome TaxID=1076179 RepID=A0A645C5F2_9ZZZZ
MASFSPFRNSDWISDIRIDILSRVLYLIPSLISANLVLDQRGDIHFSSRSSLTVRGISSKLFLIDGRFSRTNFGAGLPFLITNSISGYAGDAVKNPDPGEGSSFRSKANASSMDLLSHPIFFERSGRRPSSRCL